jgi:NAD(P)-dependent dehydrogenase (short-subunit alcohol dehydrogenase family)
MTDAEMPGGVTEALVRKVAIVTGGGTGIGQTIAHALADEGYAVIIAGRTRAALDRSAAGRDGIVAVETDVSREIDVEQLFAACDERFGRLDLLVNNAGIPGPVCGAESMDPGAWDEIFAVNVRGVMLCTKHAIPRLKLAGGGAIVNMSSLMGLRGYPMRSAYAATKFALIGMTESIAQEVGIHNIRVNALCPGAVRGELMERVVARRAAAEGLPPDEITRKYTDLAALRRWVEPEEVARAVLFLASDAAAAITGDRIKIDAGRL